MLIQTKYALGETIWFIASSGLQCNYITGIDTCSDDKGVRVAYITTIKGPGDIDMPVAVNEIHAFSSKDELVCTITERFYASINAGSA